MTKWIIFRHWVSLGFCKSGMQTKTPKRQVPLLSSTIARRHLSWRDTVQKAPLRTKTSWLSHIIRHIIHKITYRYRYGVLVLLASKLRLCNHLFHVDKMVACVDDNPPTTLRAKADRITLQNHVELGVSLSLLKIYNHFKRRVDTIKRLLRSRFDAVRRTVE